jgi:ketosteroid isomerase-like protein
MSLRVYTGKYKETGKNMRAPFAHVWRIADGNLAQFNMYTNTWLVRVAMPA